MSGGVRGDARKRDLDILESTNPSPRVMAVVDELRAEIAAESLVDLVAAMNEAHDQMTAAWSYYIEAKAAFSIAAGELALHKHRNGSALAAALIEHQEKP